MAIELMPGGGRRARFARLSCLLALLAGWGCGHRDFAAPVLEPPLSAAVQAQGIAFVNQFVGDLDRKDYSSADKMLAPALQSNWSPGRAAQYMRTNGYWMLAGSRGWKFNQVQGLRHGREMVVHAQFYNDPKNMLYHTNFSFARSGSGWLIDYIMNPVQKTRPVSVPISVIRLGGQRP